MHWKIPFRADGGQTGMYWLVVTMWIPAVGPSGVGITDAGSSRRLGR